MLQQIWATRGASNQGTRAFPFRPSDASACSVRLTQEDKLARLRWVVQRTGSKVVLSTDWRRDPDLKHRLIQTLKTYEVEVIGATLKGPQLQPVRPREISAWLDGYEAERRFHSQQPVCAWVAYCARCEIHSRSVSSTRAPPTGVPCTMLISAAHIGLVSGSLR